MDTIKSLCTPALVYLVISVLSIITVALQNLGNTKDLCVGKINCKVQNTSTVFLTNILWIAFWTWILSILCKNGYTNVAWFLVLLPFILLFIMLVLVADMVLTSPGSGNSSQVQVGQESYTVY